MVIGFIGLGDVGSRFSSGITREGAATLGFDKKYGLERFREKEERCKENGVRFAASAQELVSGSDIILVATSCAEALETADEILPFLRKGQHYVELNSAIPSIKREIQDKVEERGAHFVDGGILDTPLNGWHKIPVALSGECAGAVADALNAYGMNMRNVGPKVGQASGLKVLRSIFTKGIEALLLETFVSAYHYDVLDEVYGSIQEMLTREPICPMLERMVTTDAVHASRRAKEVGAVADMLRGDHMDATMSQAAFEKLTASAASGQKEHFDAKEPENYLDVVRYLAQLRTK